MKRKLLALGIVLASLQAQAQWMPGNVQGLHADIQCADTSTCYIGSLQGIIHKTTDGGLTWQNISDPNTTGNVRGMYCFDENTCLFAIDGYKMLKTTDGGESWESWSLPDGMNPPTSMSFVGEDVGYGVADHSAGLAIQLWKTTDGGLTWDYSFLQFGEMFFHNKIVFTDANNGYLLSTRSDSGTPTSSTIRKSEDGGETWNKIIFDGKNDSIQILDFQFLDDGITGFAGGFWIGESQAGEPNARLYKTTDAGETWSQIETGDLGLISSLSFANEYTGGLGGVNQIRKTIDGGQTWINQDFTFGVGERIRYPHKDKGFLLTGNNVYINYEKGDTLANIESMETKNLLGKIYPNPVNNQLNIVLTDYNEQVLSFTLYDIAGKPIKTKEINSLHTYLDCSDLPKGMYFYQLKSKNNLMATGKVVKH